MASFQFTVEQISFASEDLPIDSSSLDSLSSVVDPNVDFASDIKLEDNNNEGKNLARKSPTVSFNIPDKNTMEKHSSVTSVDASEETNDSDSKNIHSSYPTISIAIAHVINQNNPEIYREAGKYFKTDNLNSSDTSDNYLVSDSITNISPLRSMSATSEALALQHSVIGNLSVQPVSADIVAQVVAKTRLQLEKKELTPSTRVGANTESSPLTEQNYSNPEMLNPEAPPKVDLIRYPPDIISSTVEKRSWFSSSSFETPIDNVSTMYSNQSPNRNHLHSRSSSLSSINSTSCKKSSRTNASDLPKVHSSKI